MSYLTGHTMDWLEPHHGLTERLQAARDPQARSVARNDDEATQVPSKHFVWKAMGVLGVVVGLFRFGRKVRAVLAR